MAERMTKLWQMQVAKSRLGEIVDRAQHSGAQTLTRHGRPVAVVLSVQASAQLQSRCKIVDVLRKCPVTGLAMKRLGDTSRAINL